MFPYVKPNAREKTGVKIHNKVFFKSHHECKIPTFSHLSEKSFLVKRVSPLSNMNFRQLHGTGPTISIHFPYLFRLLTKSLPFLSPFKRSNFSVFNADFHIFSPFVFSSHPDAPGQPWRSESDIFISTRDDYCKTNSEITCHSHVFDRIQLENTISPFSLIRWGNR